MMESSSMMILQTKLHRPPIASNLVCRKVLHNKLDIAHHIPLTLVSAPAGYGKSTLIAHWLETSKLPATWLSLDKDDRDIKTFTAYILKSVQSLFPDACRKTEGLLNSSDLPSIPKLAAFLCNDLARIDTDFILALDDYHQIQGEDVPELLSELLKRPPRTMHLVIMTRRNPRLPAGPGR